MVFLIYREMIVVEKSLKTWNLDSQNWEEKKINILFLKTENVWTTLVFYPDLWLINKGAGNMVEEFSYVSLCGELDARNIGVLANQ